MGISTKDGCEIPEQGNMAGVDLGPILYPHSVAVIGASSAFGKWGQLILTNIVAGGFEGEIYPVNPKASSLCGLTAYKTVTDIPQPVDVAFITVPAPGIPAVLEDCGKKGVKGLVVITSGFSETGGEGLKLEREIVEICNRFGMVLIGPNTMGIISPYAKLFATGTHTRPRPGGVAFISQSGNLGNQLVHWASHQGIGISQFVGSGNEAMLGCAEYLEFLEQDDHARIIILYMENVGNGKRFLEVAERVNRTKPVIVLKGGRTSAGKAAAASHTGSMGGEYRIFRAACRQAGVLSVDAPAELLDLSAGFSSLPLPKGDRVGIVTLGGGWGVVTADACNEKGLRVPPIPESIIARLNRYLPPFWSKSNPLDLVGTRDTEVPVVAVEELLKWDGVDAVISLGIIGRTELVRLLVDSTGKVDHEASGEALKEILDFVDIYEQEYVATMVELMEKYEKPVIGVSLTRSEKGTVRPIDGKRYAGVFYQTPEAAVNVLGRMVQYWRFHRDRGGAS
ncbi:MAG TPA: hypothetical protein ENF92_04160 [Desulfobacteraceae bacterium]|nr:hypothetical protein [Desulfobacteraceae bacterium]